MRVETLLRERGAETIAHPGGTLYEHLLRVRDRLRSLGLSETVQLAGLAHAVYGTDGFDRSLLDLREREWLASVIGADAELLVYRYGACDRKRTWPGLAKIHEIWDRWTGEVSLLDSDDVRDFADLSIVNELDVLEQSPETRRRFGAYFRELFPTWPASESVLCDVGHVLG